MYSIIKMWAAGVVFLTCLALARPASAAPNAEAQRMLEEGKRAYDSGHFAEALARYDLSYQLEPSPQTQLLIGQAADSDGQVERALSAYRAYLRGVPNAPNKDFVSARIARLQKAPDAVPRVESRVVGPVAAAVEPVEDPRSSGVLADTAFRGGWSADDEAWYQRNRGFRNAGKLITAFGGLLCLTALAQLSGPSDSAYGLGVAGASIYGVGSLFWAASAMYGTNELNRRGVRVSKVGAIMTVVGVFGPPIMWIAGPMQNANLRRAHETVAPTHRAALDYLPGLGYRTTF